MQLCKVHQRLGAMPPDRRILDLQPVETPFKNPRYTPAHVGTRVQGHNLRV